MNNLSISCRFCSAELNHTFIDLGMSPVANDYIKPENEQSMEPFYPLHVFVCEKCFLVQLPNHRREEEIFTNEYAYFSSYSESWLSHAKKYVDMVVGRFKFNENSHIVELASNDGYLLQYFVEKNIPVLGIEPCANVAEAAEKKGIASLVEFFGEDIATKLQTQNKGADLIIGNNVLAHVPDLNDFVKGMKILLNPGGVVTIEFPHLMNLIKDNQFDTIYHEHYSYFSFSTVQKIFAYHGLTLFDVEEIPTHGGSLRIYGKHVENNALEISPNVAGILEKEQKFGILQLETYTSFEEKVKKTKRDLLEMLITLKNEGKHIVAYGAAAKGVTLINYCGIRRDFLDYVVDKNPHKQNHFMPGVHIPIVGLEKITETKPDYILILPWNIKKEVSESISYIREWGGKFIVPIPNVYIID